MRFVLPQLTPLAAALVAALFAPAAMSVPVVGATSSAEAPLGSPGTPSPGSAPGYESSNTSASDSVNSASGYAFANSAGAYAVGTSAQGSGQAGGGASFTSSITNSSGAAQHYFLTLKIYGGSISTNLFSDAPGLSAGESLVSAYNAVVKLGAATVFSSAATLTQNDAGISLSRSGTVLTGADDPATGLADGSYSWGLDYYNIDLGVVADGASVTLQALLDGSSYANVGTYDFGGNGGDGYGGCNPEVALAQAQRLVGDENVEVPLCTRAKGYASEFYGDPIGLDADAFSVNAVSVDVPEPGALPLVALGLAAAVWSGRRRRNPSA